MKKKNKPPFGKGDPFYQREAQKYTNPIPSREYILQTLAKHPSPVQAKHLEKVFELYDEDSIEGLRRRLKAMLRDGQVIKTSSGYTGVDADENAKELTAKLNFDRDGQGYVRDEKDEKVYFSGRQIRGLFDGDIIKVKILRPQGEKQKYGAIVEVLTRIVPKVIGKVERLGEEIYVVPLDKRYQQDILLIEAKSKQDSLNSLSESDIVEVVILREEEIKQLSDEFQNIYSGGQWLGSLLTVLGDPNTPGIEIQMALRKYDLPQEFSMAAMQFCKKLPKKIGEKTIASRVDIRDLPLVTIDGEDAKDFDDAVYCEQLENSDFRLLVAIADVSFYVKENSPLDVDAIERGNSTYFPGLVIPMLPEVLSNELCSLKPEVDRLCMVADVRLTSKGAIKRAHFYPAVMRSKARLTYTEVAGILDGNKHLIKRYSPLITHIRNLQSLYHVLHKHREQRGALDFETIETQILFDPNGKIEAIRPVIRNEAHKIIEECMLVANVCAAKFILKNKRSTLFRLHEGPPSDKLVALRDFLAEMGLDLKGGKTPSPLDYKAVIEKVRGRPDEHVIQTVLLRSLSQAEYSPKTEGHFGLAYTHYLHFTSPIRRYPDLLVHRTIKEILTARAKAKAAKSDEEISEETAEEDKTLSRKSRKSIDDEHAAIAKKQLEELGIHCSMTERRSDEATRFAVMALKCDYMKNKIGEVFEGTITGVTSFGLFVELKDVYIEGLIHITRIGDEYFYFEAYKHRLIGELSRKVYRLGDPIRVQVVAVNVDEQKIDLEMIQGEGEAEKGKRQPLAKKGERRGRGKEKGFSGNKSKPSNGHAKRSNKQEHKKEGKKEKKKKKR